MQIGPAVANGIWGTASLSAWRRFARALRDPAAAQEQLLRRYLRENAATVAGRKFGFSSIASIDDYQSRVPISTFDSIDTFVQRVAAGEHNVLTCDPVRRLVPSSGSTSAVKLIPYTATLQREFSEAVDAWIADLYLRRPRLMLGPAYWSITPATAPERPFVNAQSNVAIGFDDDSAYLGGVRSALARAVMAVPATVRFTCDLPSFRRTTLRHLLCARELRLISVWHPSFLSTLLDTLAKDWGAILDEVSAIDTARARKLRRIAPDQIPAIWPHLGLISCWGDGPAHASADELAARLPGVEVQRKGLLATEGVVTIPFGGHHPLAIRSHFFEFLTADGRAVLAHQLEPGVEYSVILTTGGGLYRYHLADRVIVTGRVERTPSLAFVGKDDRVSDRRGEKLSDGFVAGVFDTLFAARTPRPRFAMLAPEERESSVCYTLFIDAGSAAGECADDAEAARLAAMLETGLRANPHYAWCVDIGQLHPARVVRVGPGADRAYVDFCVAQGQRMGDVKPVSLHPGTEWSRVLPC
jgi:hypothetical protein